MRIDAYNSAAIDVSQTRLRRRSARAQRTSPNGQAGRGDRDYPFVRFGISQIRW